MIKRVAVCILCMMMALSICVSAESMQSGIDAVTEQQTMPQNGERPAGGRGGMGGMQPPNGERPPMPADGEMPQRPEGEAPAEFNGERPQPPRDEAMQQTTGTTTGESKEPKKDNGTAEETQKTNESGETTADKEFEMPQGGMGGRGGFGGMMQQGQNTTETESTPMTFAGFLKEYQTPIISVILLALAFVFVIFYKRKIY